MARQKRLDSSTESKFIRELRKRNQRLAAENRQLRKELRRLSEGAAEDSSEEESEVPALAPGELQEKQFSCPKCGAYTNNKIQLRGKTYYRCEGCGSKGPVTEKQEILKWK